MTDIHYLAIIDLMIALILIEYLRRQDVYHPEPRVVMLAATLFGGAISVSICFAIITILRHLNLYTGTSLLNFFIFTGPIEETSKLIGFLLFVRLCKIRFDEPVDAIIYISCSALGFALIENFFYALEKPITLGVRSVLTTSAHVMFSSVMGLFFAYNINQKNWILNLFKAVLLASFLHGLYDFLVTIGFMRGKGMVLIMGAGLYWCRQIFAHALLKSPHRKSMEQMFAQKTRDLEDYCLQCIQQTSHRVYEFRGPMIKECSNCKQVILPAKGFEKFLNYFLPFFELFTHKKQSWKEELYALGQKIPGKNGENFVAFNILETGPKVEQLAQKFCEHFEQSNTYSFVLGTRSVFSPDNGILVDQYRKAMKDHGSRAILILFAVIAAMIAFAWILVKLTKFLVAL